MEAKFLPDSPVVRPYSSQKTMNQILGSILIRLAPTNSDGCIIRYLVASGNLSGVANLINYLKYSSLVGLKASWLNLSENNLSRYILPSPVRKLGLLHHALKIYPSLHFGNMGLLLSSEQGDEHFGIKGLLLPGEQGDEHFRMKVWLLSIEGDEYLWLIYREF